MKKTYISAEMRIYPIKKQDIIATSLGAYNVNATYNRVAGRGMWSEDFDAEEDMY